MLEHRSIISALRGFAVVACLAALVGCGAGSNAKSADTAADTASGATTPTIVIPNVPGGVNATAANAKVNLNWTASDGASTYNVKRATTSGGPYTQIASAQTTTYADPSVNNNTAYFYVVSAVNSAGESANSAQATATPSAPASKPPVPAGVTATAANAKVTLSWTASNGASTYNVKRATTSGGPYAQLASIQTTTYADSSVSNNTAYFYVVSSVNSAGESANSAQVTATPSAPASPPPTPPPSAPPTGPSGTLPTVACTNLGTPGTWQNITPPIYGNNTTYNPSDFVVDKNTGLVYVGTDSFDDGNSKGVQRSADCGNTWVQVSTGAGSNEINGGRQWTFAINNLDGRIMYTNSGYYDGGLWKSYDGGVDWTAVTPKADGAPGFIGYLQMDPENPDHLLVTWHEPCYGTNNQFTYDDQVGCFHESMDGGLTWKGHYSSDGTNWPAQVRVLLLHGSTWIVLANTTLRTTDGGQTFKPVNDNSLGGHSSGTLSRADNGTFFIGTEFGAYVSTAASDGQSWTEASGQWVGEIADTGSLLYETQQSTTLATSPSSDGLNWQAAPTTPFGCEFAHYDVLHKVLYISCLNYGFYRLVVQ